MLENIRLTKQVWLGHLLGRNLNVDGFVKEAVTGLNRIDQVFRSEVERLTLPVPDLPARAESQPLPVLDTREGTPL